MATSDTDNGAPGSARGAQLQGVSAREEAEDGACRTYGQEAALLREMLYVRGEIERLGAPLAARLITAAAVSLRDEVSGREEMSGREEVSGRDETAARSEKRP